MRGLPESADLWMLRWKIEGVMGRRIGDEDEFLKDEGRRRKE